MELLAASVMILLFWWLIWKTWTFGIRPRLFPSQVCTLPYNVPCKFMLQNLDNTVFNANWISSWYVGSRKISDLAGTYIDIGHAVPMFKNTTALYKKASYVLNRLFPKISG